MFVGLANVILLMMFVILCSHSFLLCLVELASFLNHFVLPQGVCVFFPCFACRMRILHWIMLYEKNIVVIIRSPCISYDALASDNSLSKEYRRNRTVAMHGV